MTGNDLAPGPEMDAAVAKACGIDAEVRDICCDHGYYPKTCAVEGEPWEPSTDLNAAFAAAEKAGLFDDGQLAKSGGEWYVVDYSGCCSDDPCAYSSLPSGTTPAEAICRAILALKGSEHA